MKRKKATAAVVIVVALVCLAVIGAVAIFTSNHTREQFYSSSATPSTAPRAAPGASQENTDIAEAVADIMKKHNLTSVSDIGCGDAAWVPLLLAKMPAVKYTGYEKSPSLVEDGKTVLSKYPNATIQMADPMSVKPVPADLMISRNFLQTLSYANIRKAIETFSAHEFRYVALGNFAFDSSDNRDIEEKDTAFLMNLEKYPFNMSPAYIGFEGDSNRRLFVYSSTQMKAYPQTNQFWKNPTSIK